MNTIYAIDFGTSNALVIYGPTGLISKKALKLPHVKGGRTPAMEFPMVAGALLRGSPEVPAGDIVVESPTFGSSGCERKDALELVQQFPGRKIFTLTARAVKNFRADHPEFPWKKGGRYAKPEELTPKSIELLSQVEVHEEDAFIMYMIAIETPNRLYHWTKPSGEVQRINTSVRPMDKNYYGASNGGCGPSVPGRDDRAEEYMSLLPPYNTLPQELRDVLGNGKYYSRSMVMPFAMASTEPYLEDGPPEERRRRYEKIIGLYDRGYPSFYRRATIVWMQAIAKTMADVTKINEVTPAQRKEAWKITQRQVRKFFHLTMAHQGC